MSSKTLLVILILIPITILSVFHKETFGSDESYDSLLDRVKKFDQSVDFMALRLAYTKTDDYNPYADDTESRNAMFNALEQNQYEKAVTFAQAILDKNYVDIDAHFVSRIAYKEMNNIEKFNFHRFVTDGLIKSILNSGDGKTPETAYLVINTNEEYVILAVLGFKLDQQKLFKSGDHSYDRMEVEHVKTGETSVLYFNIDIPFNQLSKKLK